eukprot:5603370-Amphidinium_carterae.1
MGAVRTSRFVECVHGLKHHFCPQVVIVIAGIAGSRLMMGLVKDLESDVWHRFLACCALLKSHRVLTTIYHRYTNLWCN